MPTSIIGVKLENRLECAVEFQKIVTKFGCQIRTRLGLHPPDDFICLNYGIVLLEVLGEPKSLINELSKTWDVQTMVFE